MSRRTSPSSGPGTSGTIENGAPEATLVVEFVYETDPTAPDFDREGIDEIRAAIAAQEPGEVPPAHVKIIPRMYG